MKTPINKIVTTPSAVITKTNKIMLRKRAAIPDKGWYDGHIGSAEFEVSPEGAAEEINDLNVAVELHQPDPKIPKFRVVEKYNMLENGRGLNSFKQDYLVWFGEEFNEDLLYRETDFDEMLKGAPVRVEIDHRRIGKEWVPFIKAFEQETPVAAA